MRATDRALLIPAIVGLVVTSAGLGSWVTSRTAKLERYPSYLEAASAGQDSKANPAPTQKHPCRNPLSREESDLCAQWNAANAAGDAVLWAMMGTLIATLGTLGLYWQIMLTRRAVEDTTKATQAMLDANEIADRNARRGLRPYVYPSHASFTIDESGEPTAVVTHKNFGQTPALNLRGWTHTWVEGFPLHGPLPEAPSDLLMGSAVVGPSAVSESVQPHGLPISEVSRQRIEAGTAALYVYGYHTYLDIFGREHFSRFIYFASGFGSLERGRLSPYTSGNLIDGN